MSVRQIGSAIHLRTGQRARVEAVDTWLARHEVPVAAFDDAYDACVHLLLHCADIPDLAVVGVDWLTPDEFQILAYIRQTWPHAVIVVYGGEGELPGFDLLPLTQAYARDGGIQTMLADTPEEIVRRLRGRRPSLTALARPESVGDTGGSTAKQSASSPLPFRSPRAILTAEETAALLESRDEP